MEIIKLNLIPTGVNPTCHCSQYDEGRVIRIELFDGLTPYTLQSGDTVTLNVRKPDNTIVTATVETTQGNNYVDIVTTEQICACVGYNLCDLTITNGSVVIGTLNFIMAIERDVLADGIPSQSVIEDLDERIAEAIGDNYYNKTETDALLALKADKSEFYNFYPTEQESGAIASFTDGAENIPVKSLVSQIVAVQSGSGTPSPSNPRAITGFDSGIITRCGKNIFPLVAGTTKTSNGITWKVENDLSISVKGTVTGRSYFTLLTHSSFKPNTYTYLVEKSGTNADIITWIMGSYYKGTNTYRRNEAYPGHETFIVTDNDYATADYSMYFDIPATAAGTTFDCTLKLQVEIGNQSTNYEAYNGNNYNFNFGQTVYGGYFDNTGNLVVTYGIIDMGSLSWSRNATYNVYYAYVSGKANGRSNLTCEIFRTVAKYYEDLLNEEISGALNNNAINVKDDRYTTVEDFKTAVTGVKLKYELATPIEYSLTPTEIKTLYGLNNIFADTGDVDVTIRADIGLYIDKRLNTTRSTPTLSLSKGNSTLSETQVKYEDPVEESEDNNEER